MRLRLLIKFVKSYLKIKYSTIAYKYFFCYNVHMKKSFLEHILYEMYMYLWAHNTVRYSVPDIYIHNAIWISYNISLRNLLYFFSMRDNYKVRQNDILYKNFVFNGKIGKFIKTPTYTIEINCIDKSVAHLTRERFDGINNKNLKNLIVSSQKKFYPMIRRRITDFIKHLQHDKDIFYKGVNVDLKDELKTEEIKHLIDQICTLL